MNYKRREFLKIGGSLAAAFAVTPKLFSMETETAKLAKFGIQLWTVKTALGKDPQGILKQLSDDGYKQIESFEGSKGMFWGMSNTDFKKYVDDLGITIISSHCNIQKDFEKKADDAAAIGMKYLLSPYITVQKTVDDYKKIADQFNKCGEICKKAGIRFAYHNHDHDFNKVDNQIGLDIYLQNTDAALVDFEMDIYWVVTAGQDPEEWLKKYMNRFRLCHIKDRIKNTTEKDASCILGEGSIDFPKIIKTAKANGMQYYIVEQERYDNTTEMDCAKADAEYLKKFKF
ncbi:MAG: sugar phosphate isomerase/epimerase family protein [Chitinophagales bacterium]